MPPASINADCDCVLEITQGHQSVKFRINFGEVWILLGQSNAVMPMLNITNSTEELKIKSRKYYLRNISQ